MSSVPNHLISFDCANNQHDSNYAHDSATLLRCANHQNARSGVTSAHDCFVPLHCADNRNIQLDLSSFHKMCNTAGKDSCALNSKHPKIMFDPDADTECCFMFPNNSHVSGNTALNGNGTMRVAARA